MFLQMILFQFPSVARGTKYIITRYRLPRGTTPLFVHFFIKSHNAGLYLTSVSFDLEVERLILTINHTGRLTGSFRPANIEIVNRIYDKTPQFGTWGYKVHAIHSMLMWIALLWLYLCSVVWNVSAHSRAFICITILGSAANYPHYIGAYYFIAHHILGFMDNTETKYIP